LPNDKGLDILWSHEVAKKYGKGRSIPAFPTLQRAKIKESSLNFNRNLIFAT
jgi:hypothetical protein